MAPSIWNDWLPEPLATRIRTEEPARFDALIQALATLWQQQKASKSPDCAATETLPYVPLIRAFLNAKAEPPLPSIQLLTETLLDIVMTCQPDLAAQVRWGALLNRLLRCYRRKLKLSIPWRPLCTMLRHKVMGPSLSYEGIGVSQARSKTITTLIHRARRFFPPGSAEEIWSQFGAAIRDVTSPDAFEALGWLSTLLPTHAASKRDGNWGIWAKEWLQLWSQVTHVQYWHSLWLGLFARLIRHDVHGLVDWSSLLPQLSTKFLWVFNVPVGTATASPPFSGSAPGPCMMLFGDSMGSRSAAVAHAFIYLLGRCPPGSFSDQDTALLALEETINLLDQYYHPSNGGKWTSGLSVFLRELSSHLCRRLVCERGHGTNHLLLESLVNNNDSNNKEQQQYIDVSMAYSSDEEGDLSDDGEENDIDGDDDDDDDIDLGDDDDEDSGCCGNDSDDLVDEGEKEVAQLGRGTSNRRQPPSLNACARRPLTTETCRRVATKLIRLASKGQSSKDGHMKRNSSVVLSQLANVAPDLVLHSVYDHFLTAMETVTAAKQYGNAIQTLSLCVRPLLLAGLSKADAPEEFEMVESVESMRASAAQAIAAAMMATLPGIDANDPPKSLSVFRLYCCILSCIKNLPDDINAPAEAQSVADGKPNTAGVAVLPLFTEDWMMDLLSRIFTVITNLDAPDTAAEHGGREDGTSDGSTFLLEGSSMFRPLIEILFTKLPSALRTSAIKRTSSFLLDNVFTSVTSEAAVLCNAMACADPVTTVDCMLIPLLSALEKDVGAVKNTERLSRVSENALKWRLSLLSSTAYRLGSTLVPHGQRIRSILSSMASVKSQAVQEATAQTLASVLQCLCTYYPLEQCAASIAELSMPSSSTALLASSVAAASSFSIEAYVDQSSKDQLNVVSGFTMAWHVPNSEELALCNEILDQFAHTPATKLIQAGNDLTKESIRSCVLQIEGCLSGVRSCLPEFPSNMEYWAQHAQHNSVSIIGELGPSRVGSPHLRAIVATALSSACRAIASSDSETHFLLLRTIDLVLCSGEADHRDANASASSWASDEKWMHEPPIIGLLLDTLGDVELNYHHNNNNGSNGSKSPGTKIERGYGFGAKWRRRRPMWIAQEKAYLNMQWRSSQAAYRWFPTSTQPTLPISALSSEFLELFGRGVDMMLQGMSGVRSVAGAVIERILKRYPVLTPSVVAPMLCGIAKIEDSIAYCPQKTPRDVLDKLIYAAKKAAVRAASVPGDSVESDQDQAMACGSSAILRGNACWRYLTRDWHGFHAYSLALTAGAAHTGVEAQTNLNFVSVLTILRYMRPPSNDALGLSLHDNPVAGAIVEESIAAAATTTTTSSSTLNPHDDTTIAAPSHEMTVALPWKYTVSANCMPLLFLPSLGPVPAAALARHYLSILESDIPITRYIGAGGINALMMPLYINSPNKFRNGIDDVEENSQRRQFETMSAESVAAARRILADILASSAHVFIPKFMKNLTNSHPALSAGAEAARTALVQQFKDDLIPKTILGAFMMTEWPGGQSTVPAVSRGHFIPTHARVIQVLCMVASEPVLQAIRPFIETTLMASVSQDIDRPAVAVAAEALAGILSCPFMYSSPHWTDWVRNTLKKSMLVAPLEHNVDIWCATIRFAIHNLVDEHDVLHILLESILDDILGLEKMEVMGRGNGQVDGGGGSSHSGHSGAMYKKIIYAREALEELELSLGISSTSPSLRNLLSRLLDELPLLVQSPGEMVRQAAAGLASEVILSLLVNFIDDDNPHRQELMGLRRRAINFAEKLGSEFDAATAVLYMHARQTGNDAVLGTHEPTTTRIKNAIEVGMGVGVEAAEEEEVAGGDDDDDDVLGMDVEEDQQGGHTVSISPATTSSSSSYQTAVSRVAFSVEWLLQLLESNTSGAAPLVARSLPSLFRLQELVPSELQFVALVSRKALIAAKYLPFSLAEIPAVLAALQRASSADLWPERAASLIFAQYFWFRHALLLGSEGTNEVLKMVLERMEDEKLEVRELAAATLSGVIRGLKESDASQLRNKFLSRALEVFPVRSRRRRQRTGDPLDSTKDLGQASVSDQTTATPASVPLPVKHGVALALQALVLSSPYDVPSWLPDVLMALVRLASEPAPIKTTVTKALGAFRRTHEEGGLVEVKESLTVEQWEAIRDVASPASYFV